MPNPITVHGSYNGGTYAVPWFINGRILKQSSVNDEGLRFYDRVLIPICQMVDRLTGPSADGLGFFASVVAGVLT